MGYRNVQRDACEGHGSCGVARLLSFMVEPAVGLRGIPAHACSLR